LRKNGYKVESDSEGEFVVVPFKPDEESSEEEDDDETTQQSELVLGWYKKNITGVITYRKKSPSIEIRNYK
jgi:hypothetical protein